MATEAELRASIAEIDDRAKPLREKRETISQQIENLKHEARDLTRQINDVEDQAQLKNFELKLLLKRANRLISMPITST